MKKVLLIILECLNDGSEDSVNFARFLLLRYRNTDMRVDREDEYIVYKDEFDQYRNEKAL